MSEKPKPLTEIVCGTSAENAGKVSNSFSLKTVMLLLKRLTIVMVCWFPAHAP
jgi:hypothetical protein